jgi:opacity protein-like surface antigen
MKPVFISALCLMSIFSFAQNDPANQTKTTGTGKAVSFGIKGGANISNLEDNQTANTTSRTAFHVGALVHIHLSPNIAIQPEVSYSSQGAKYPNLGVEKVNYVNIPVLFQYMFNGGLRLETGPQLGILTSAQLERYSGGDMDVKSQFSNGDFSWAFGIGYLSNVGLGIDARYNLGLINVVNTDQHDVKNRVWQFGLFYQFMK